MLELAIGVIMAVMLVVLIVNPKRWTEPAQALESRPRWWVLLGFVGVGFYGGFIQAGVGILLLVGLVMGAGLGAMHANSIKLFLTLLFTAASLAIFALNDQVAWSIGLVVALGQASGAYAGARFLAHSETASVWIRRVLIAVVAVSCAKFFGLF